MKARAIIEYILAALIVLILGALSGWYFFLRTQTQSTQAQSAARGYETEIPSASGVESTASVPETESDPQKQTPQASMPAPGEGFLSRMWNALMGRGTGVSEPAGSVSFGEAASFSNAALQIQTAPAQARPQQLWQVQNKPVAGMAFVQIGGNTRLRYVERSSGHVFDADPETGSIVRLTNTLMPKIYEAIITENHIIVRSLDAGDAITTFVGSIATSTQEDGATSTMRALAGVQLAKNIMYVSADPRSTALFYTVKDTDGVLGIRSEWNGTKQKQIFRSALMNWRSTLLQDGRTILAQAPLDSTLTHAYELKGDGSLVRLLDPAPGLTILPRSGGALLWGSSSGGSLGLFVKVNPSASSVQLPIRTIADKCVWAKADSPIAYCGVPQGIVARNFIDEWYRGAAHSSDAIWRVDAGAGSAELVYAPPTGTSIDVENLTLDSKGDYLSFTNAADKSLWLFRLVK